MTAKQKKVVDRWKLSGYEQVPRYNPEYVELKGIDFNTIHVYADGRAFYRGAPDREFREILYETDAEKKKRREEAEENGHVNRSPSW